MATGLWSSEGLDPAQLVAGTGLWEPDPNAPGPFKRGLKVGWSSDLPSIAGGVMQYAGRATGWGALEKKGEEIGQAAATESAPYRMQVEDVGKAFDQGIIPGLKSSADLVAYTIGNQIPMLATSVAGGVLGRVAAGAFGATRAMAGLSAAEKAAAVARTAAGVGTATDTAVAGALKAADLGAGIGYGTASSAMELGQIAPEGLKPENNAPLTQIALASLISGATDTAIPYYLATKLGLVGAAKRVLTPRAAGFGAIAKDIGTTALKAGGFEAGQETLQNYIERAGANQKLTGEDANSGAINSLVMGGIMGLVGGGVAGGFHGMARPVIAPVQPEPAPTEPVQPPEVVTPEQQHVAATQAMATFEAGITQARAAQQAASDRLAELTAERKLDFNKGRRSYPEIDAERKTVQEQARKAKETAKSLEDQWYAAKATVTALAPQVSAAAVTAGLTETPPASLAGDLQAQHVAAQQAALTADEKVAAIDTVITEKGGKVTKELKDQRDAAVKEQVTARAAVDQLTTQSYALRQQAPEVVPEAPLPELSTVAERTATVPEAGPAPDTSRVLPAVVEGTTRTDQPLPVIIGGQSVSADQASQAAVRAVHAIFRGQEMPLTTTRESLATPPLTVREQALAKVEQRTPRETVQTDTTAQMAAIEDHAMPVIEPMAMELAKTKSTTVEGQKKTAAALTKVMRTVVQEAAKQPTVEAAQAYITEKLPNALKGRGVMIDAPDIAKAISAVVGQALGVPRAEPRLIGSGSIVNEPLAGGNQEVVRGSLTRAAQPVVNALVDTKGLTVSGKAKVIGVISKTLDSIAQEAAGMPLKEAHAHISSAVPKALEGRVMKGGEVGVVAAMNHALKNAHALITAAGNRINTARDALDSAWAKLNNAERVAIDSEVGRGEFELAVAAQLEGKQAAVKGFLAKVSETVRTAFRKIVAVLMSLVVAIHTANFNDAQAFPMPDRVTTVNVQTIVEKPKARFNGVEHSSMSELVANWVTATNAHQGKAFIVADKADGKIYAFSANGSVIADAPALYGEALKDTMTPEQLAMPMAKMTKADKITPAGAWTITMESHPNYEGGWALDFKGGNGLLVHSVYLGVPSENRLARLASTTPGDNFISWGCINVPDAFAQTVLKPNFATGEHGLFVIPIQTENTMKTFGIMEQDLMPTVTDTQRTVTTPEQTIGVTPTQEGAIAGRQRTVGNARGRRSSRALYSKGAITQDFLKGAPPEGRIAPEGTIMWHITRRANRESIQKNGLRLSGVDNTNLWLFPDQQHALASSVAQWGDPNRQNDIWQVDVGGQQVYADPHPGWPDKVSVVVKKEISPSKLALIGEGNAFSRAGLTQGGFNESAYRPAVVSWAKTTLGDTIAPNGHPIWQNFVAWFGDSKAVDAEGKPLVVYHGTIVWEKPSERTGKQIGDITVFNPHASTEIVGRSRSMDTVGIWTVPSPEAANMYAGKEGDIYPLYVRVVNPKMMTWAEFETLGQKLDKNWKEKDTRKGGKIVKYASAPGAFDGSLVAAELELQGYDGIKFLASSNVDGHNQDVWVAFRPEQIKSSTGNNGNFDQVNPDITQSRAGLDQDTFDNLPEPAKGAAVDEWNRIQMQYGTEIRNELRRMLGDDPNLVVKTFQATPDSPVGSYTRVDKWKAVIAAALNASDRMSLAAHEGFHYAEDRLLTNAERQIVANAMKADRPMMTALIERAQQYDRENKTHITDDITGRPAEARAYAFQFWRLGELQAQGPLQRIFQKLKDFFDRVKNMVDGLGFTSIDSIFTALDRGQFAERGGREQYGLEQTEMPYVSAASVEFSDQMVAKKERDIALRTRLSNMTYEELDTELNAAIDSNRNVDRVFMEKEYPTIASEFEKWGQRKREAWLNEHLLVGQENALQAQYTDDETIREFRGVANDFDTESPKDLGRSIAVKARNIDSPGFFISPDGFAVRNALRFAAAQGWDMDAVLDGMRTRASEWAGSDAPALFDRLFKKSQNPVVAPELIQRVEGGVPLFSRAASIDESVLDSLTPAQRTLYSNAAIATTDEYNRRAAGGELADLQVQKTAAVMIENARNRGGPENILAHAMGLAKKEPFGSLQRWWFANIATPNLVSRYSTGYRNVVHILNKYIRFRKILAQIMLREKLPSWYKASEEDRRAAFGVMLKRTVERYGRDSKELADLYKPLTEPQKKLFDEATGMIAGFLNAEFAADRIKYKEWYTSPGAYEKWEADRGAWVADMIDKGYVPLKRYGDHTVYVFTTDAKGKRISAAYQFFDSVEHANRVATAYEEEIKRFGVNLQVEVGMRHKNMRETGMSIEQFLGNLERNGVPIQQAAKERLVETLTSADSRVRNQMMHRTGLPGYSEDSMRVLHDFGVGTASKLAYSAFGAAIDAAVQGAQVTASVDYINSIPKITIGKTFGVDEAGVRNNLWERDGPMSGFYKGIADENTNFVLVPDHTGGWSRRLRAAAMVYFIGGSISGAMVNTMSIPMMLVPELSIYTNYANGLTTAMTAWKDAWRYYHILRDTVKMKDPNTVIPGIDQNLRQAILAASDTIFDTEIHQMLGMSQGTVYSKSRNVQKAMEIWMSPFRISEQTNRLASFIAAYRIASTDKNFKQVNIATGELTGKTGILQGQDLFEFAHHIVDSTQNNYGEENRPKAARNPIFALAMMFKSYPLFMIEAAHLMYKASPAAARNMLLGLVLLTGIQGLPFAEAIENLIDTIAQNLFGSPFNTRRAMINVTKQASEALVGVDLSELVMWGGLNAIAGVSASSRIGAGDFVPGTRLGTADADQGKILAQFAGAPYAMIKDAGTHIGGLFTTDWKQAADALRAGGPIALRNLIKGGEQVYDGYASDAKGRMITDVSTLSGILQMTGLSSAQVAKMYQYESINIQTKAFYTQVSSDMQDALVKAMKDGDTAKVQEINDLRNKWNSEYPTMPIMPNAAAVRRAIALAGIPLDRRSLMMWGRRIRGENIFSEDSGN